MFKTILATFEDKAFVVAFLTVLAAAGAHFGLHLDPMVIVALISPMMVAIGAHGWGAAAAQTNLTNAREARAHMTAQAQPSQDKQAGFAAIPAMLLMTLVSALAFVALSCASTAGKQATTGGVAAAGCAISDLVQYAAEVEQALATESFGQALADIAKKHNLTQDGINCLVQGVLAALTAQHAGSGMATSQESVVVTHAKVYLSEHSK